MNLTKDISNYWIKEINDKLKKFNRNNFLNTECIFEYSVINADYKIYYSKINNSLQLYKIKSKLDLFNKEANKDELVCSYGTELKSINVCIEDILGMSKEKRVTTIFDLL